MWKGLLGVAVFVVIGLALVLNQKPAQARNGGTGRGYTEAEAEAMHTPKVEKTLVLKGGTDVAGEDVTLTLVDWTNGVHSVIATTTKQGVVPVSTTH